MSFDSAMLGKTGQLQFDAATNRLVLDFNASGPAEQHPDQVFILKGVEQFDPAWLTVGPLTFL